jgi:hypothetical protein
VTPAPPAASGDIAARAGAARLACHPGNPARWSGQVRVRVAITGGGALALSYVLEGDLRRVRIPPPAPPQRTDGLWRSTCFEAFVMGADAPAYREINLSPAGHWQAYAFAARRQGMRGAVAPQPRIACRADAGQLTLRALLQPPGLPAGPRLHLGLAAVIEDTEGALSFWALWHPPGPPDFHHPRSFAMELALPGRHPPARGTP